MRDLPRGTLFIIVASATLLSLSMGIRQSLGIVMAPVSLDVGISISEFTLAIAGQNLIWGLTQPFIGALSVRTGFRPILCAGAVMYALGLVLLALADSRWGVILGAGALIGVAMSCVGPAITMAITSRVVPAAQRSLALGVLSAAGSLGAMIAAPLAQGLTAGFGWRIGVASFVLLAAVMLPAAWIAARSDRVVLGGGAAGGGSARQALTLARRETSFLVMAGAYFVCGMQLVFITTHLPAYLELCGMDPMLSASALGVIGCFNILGSLFFGWAGGRWNKLALLAAIYICRSCVLVWYFTLPPTAVSTIVFAGLMGFLWLGVAPLVGGAVADMFGLKWQAMLQGVAFMWHQLGSFMGAFGGGWVYDVFGSYDLAWRIGVALGLVAGAVQLVAALLRPSERLALVRQDGAPALGAAPG